MKDLKMPDIQKLISWLLREEDIHISSFNLLALGGILICIITSLHNAAMGFGLRSSLPILCVGIPFSISMAVFTHRTGKYHAAMLLTIFIIFIGLFTFLFFTCGGYQSGIPCFFILAVVFTAFLFDGIWMPVLVALELIWYGILCFSAFFCPELCRGGMDSKAYLTDVLVSMTTVSVSLAAIVYLQVQLYHKKQVELEQTRAKAEAANNAKTEFIARMSHDVRTPLNTIMAMNELIGANTSSRDIKEWVNGSSNSAKILLSMINDVLDISKIETGKAELNPMPYRTKQLILDVVNTWRVQTIRSGLQFVIDVDPKIPSVLVGDKMGIRKILDNLLSNALKYTENGSVCLQMLFEVKTDSQNPDFRDGSLILSVRDTGCGMDPENIEKVFQPFERGAAADSAVSGYGLGLAIVRELSEYMNGSVTCDSRPCEGTVFTVNIPQHICMESPVGTLEHLETESAQSDQKVFTAAPGVRILVVDDNMYNRKVIGMLLEPMLVQVDDVESGSDALEMIDIKEYDLILLDLRMPQMNGMETFAKIRKEYPGFHTPVIALTAELMGNIQESVLRQGFSGYLSKPVNSVQLTETIAKFLPEKMVYIPDDQAGEQKISDIMSWKSRLLPYGIDVSLGLEYSAGETGEYLARLRLFDEYAEDTLHSLEDMGESSDYYFCVHSVKSAAKGIGASLLADFAEAVEIRRDGDYYSQVHDILIMEYRRVLEGVKLFRKETGDCDEQYGNDH